MAIERRAIEMRRRPLQKITLQSDHGDRRNFQENKMAPQAKPAGPKRLGAASSPPLPPIKCTWRKSDTRQRTLQIGKQVAGIIGATDSSVNLSPRCSALRA